MKTLEAVKAEGTQQKTIAQRLVSNFGWSVVGEVTGKGILFFITIYIARHLSVENYGLFTYIQTVITYLWLAAELGVNMYGTREVAKFRKFSSEFINILYSLRILSGISVTSLIILCLIITDISYLTKIAFVCGSFYILMRSLSLDWVLRGLEDFRIVAFGNIFTFLIMGLLVVLFVKNTSDVIPTVLIWSISYLFGSLFYFFNIANKFKFRFQPVLNLKKIYIHLRESIHFTLSGAFLSAYQYLPIILLANVTTKHELGVFSVPYQLCFMITFGFSILSMSFYPVYSDSFFNHQRNFKKIHKFFLSMALIAGISIVIIVGLFAKQIVLLLYGLKYMESVKVLRILIIYVAGVMIRRVYGTAISAAGLQRYQVITSFLALVIEIIVFFVILRPFKIDPKISVSFSLVFAEFSVLPLLILFWKLKKNKTWKNVSYV